MNNIFKFIFDPKYLYIRLVSRGLIKSSDEKFIKFKYYYYFHEKLDLKNPKTFNEKLQWLKLYDRNPNYTMMVDKIDAKEYVSNIIGNKYIVPTLFEYDSVENIDFTKLPDKFILKCTHDSGGVVICKDKKNLNINKVKKDLKKSLKVDYYLSHREWPYKNIKPRILVEKYMGDNLNDYKIFCFNGKPYFTLVCSNRNGSFKNTDFYDNDWNLLPFTRANHTNSKNGIEKPSKLNEMLSIAEKLSKGIPFVRVDLYLINDSVYFGELTFFPSAGFEGFKPSFWDYKIGKLLNIVGVNTNEL